MTKTNYDIVVKSLQILNYIAPEEVPAARDFQVALDKYLNFHQWMIKEFTKTVRWQSDSVDERLWTYVSAWLANDLAFDFPNPPKTSSVSQPGRK